MKSCTMNWYDSYDSDGYGHSIDYTGGICSVCGASSVIITEITIDYAIGIRFKYPHYCPCCGAKVADNKENGSIEYGEFVSKFGKPSDW